MSLICLLSIYLIMLKGQISLKRYNIIIIIIIVCMGEVLFIHLLDIQYVRWLLDNKYTTEADGLPGNDDYGDFCRPYYIYIMQHRT